MDHLHCTAFTSTACLTLAAVQVASVGCRAQGDGELYPGRGSADVHANANDPAARGCSWQPLQGEGGSRFLPFVLGPGSVCSG